MLFWASKTSLAEKSSSLYKWMEKSLSIVQGGLFFVSDSAENGLKFQPFEGILTKTYHLQQGVVYHVTAESFFKKRR